MIDLGRTAGVNNALSGGRWTEFVLTHQIFRPRMAEIKNPGETRGFHLGLWKN